MFRMTTTISGHNLRDSMSYNVDYFPGAFAKLQKVTSSFVVFVYTLVCPSVRVEQLASHWTDFYEILYEDFSKICGENWSFIKIWQD